MYCILGGLMEIRLPDEIVNEYRLRAEAARGELLMNIPKVKLQQRNIKHCKLLLDRESLLKCLPKNAIVAEIGVDQGEFSQQILDICTPQKLHLVDAWHSLRYHEDKSLAVEKKFAANYR